MKQHEKIKELRFIRVFTPVHIPKYLVEQVRDRDYSVDDFYEYQEKACVKMGKEGPTLNPLNHLYVLADKENITKGFVWFSIDPLTKDICIQIFSMDKEYWFNGKAVEILTKFVKDIRRKADLNKVYWITNYAKHSERHGFKRSKSVLMEYKEEKDGKNDVRGNDTGRECRSSHTSTATISKRDTGVTGTGAASGSSLQPVLATV